MSARPCVIAASWLMVTLALVRVCSAYVYARSCQTDADCEYISKCSCNTEHKVCYKTETQPSEMMNPYCSPGTCALGTSVRTGWSGQKLICTACAPGTYRDFSYNAARNYQDCALCPAGKYSDVSGTVSCKSCAAGKFSVNAGQTFCNWCPVSQGRDLHESACAPCSPGRFSNGVWPGCQWCAQGEFSKAFGQTACERCPAGTVSHAGASACYPPAPGTAYLQPGVSQTCLWMNQFSNLGCACWGSGATNWNENNGFSPLTEDVPSQCSGCNLGKHVFVHDFGDGRQCIVNYFSGVPTPGAFVSPLPNPGNCSRCYQTVGESATIPANCASSGAPTVQQCYLHNGCSGCGCHRTQEGGVAMCHVCRPGYFSSPPLFTSCVACPAGSFSSRFGLLDAEEADVSSITYSFSSVRAVAGCNLPALDSDGAWCSNSLGSGWTQIDLGQRRTVKGFVTQGMKGGNQWVTQYTITHSLDGVSFSSFTHNVFSGNTDSGTRVVNFVRVGSSFGSIETRYVRLSVGAVQGWASLRWGVLVAPITSVGALREVSPCTPCPPGTFQGGSGSSSCTACPAGTFQAASGATGCDPCETGATAVVQGPKFALRVCGGATGPAYWKACTVCATGAGTMVSPCTATSDAQCGGMACDASTPRREDGYAGWISPRYRCNRGEFLWGFNTTTDKDCRRCPADMIGPNGYWCESCKGPLEEPYWLDQSVCVCKVSAVMNSTGGCECPDGRRFNQTTKTCEPCPPNTFGSGGQCYGCSAGNFSRQGATACAACDEGKYRLQGQAGECRACKQGQYAGVAWSDKCTDCNRSCEGRAGWMDAGPCPGGSGAGFRVCKPCDFKLPNRSTWAGSGGCVYVCDPGFFFSEQENGACVPCTSSPCPAGLRGDECTPYKDKSCDTECVNSSKPTLHSAWVPASTAASPCPWKCEEGYDVSETNYIMFRITECVPAGENY